MTFAITMPVRIDIVPVVFYYPAEKKSMELVHPFTMIIAGPSNSGKIAFTKSLLRTNDLFSVEFDSIIWCYSEAGSADRSPNVVYNKGLPSEDVYDGKPKLVILDDFMHETNDIAAKLYTKLSYHRNVSVIMMTHNLFPENKNVRDILLNNNYLVAFRNPRDRAQVSHLGKQLFPENTNYFCKSFANATSKPHGYLFIDMNKDTPDDQRLKTEIFHKYPVVYVPK